MEEVLLHRDDAPSLDITFLQKENTTAFLAFLQNSQSSGTTLHLSIVNYQNNQPLLLIYGHEQAFLLETSRAQAPEFERFFANLKFFVETERELATILYYLPLERQNIFDIKIAKSLCNKSHQYQIPYFKINVQEFTSEINISYIKSLVLRGMESYGIWSKIIDDLTQNGRLAIYESIISERYQKLTLYNTQENNLSRISDLYSALSVDECRTFDTLHEVLQQSAEQMKIPLANIITLQAMEALVLKSPHTFDEISHISGFNKKIVHSAVIRKILSIMIKSETKVKRDRPLEMVLDALLSSCSVTHNVEKPLIASKHDIIAFINGNLNVDFLKGWKKNVFGQRALDFLNNRSVIEAKDMQFVVSYK